MKTHSSENFLHNKTINLDNKQKHLDLIYNFTFFT